MITENKTTISEYKNFVRISDADDIRIYFTPRDEGNGFDGEIIELLEWPDDSGEFWTVYSKRRIIGKMNAAFDGIRHLYLGENGEGYIHYPNLLDWNQIIKCLEILQKVYCREA